MAGLTKEQRQAERLKMLREHGDKLEAVRGVDKEGKGFVSAVACIKCGRQWYQLWSAGMFRHLEECGKK